MKRLVILAICMFLVTSAAGAAEIEDPYLWLEEVEGEKALDWVKARNGGTVPVLEGVPGFEKARDRILDVLNSDDRIPYAAKRGKWLYNFWRDAAHPRGVYRRTTLAEYRKADPEWEVVLDFDALAEAEGENWVYKGMNWLYPDYDRALVNLSRGGADATVVREFDLVAKKFITDGFTLPEAKSNINWKDRDHIYVGTDFGEDSLSSSGYPLVVKLWKRGTPLSEAEMVYRADDTAVMGFGGRFFSEQGHLDYVVNIRTFFDTETFAIRDGKLKKLDIPNDMQLVGYFEKQLLLQPRTAWKVGGETYAPGSVLLAGVDGLLSGKKKISLLMEPTDRLSITSVDTTRSTILVTVLDNVVGKLYRFTRDGKGNWKRRQVKTPDNGTLGVFNTTEKSDDFFLNYENFLIPDSLYMVSGPKGKPELLKSRPPLFDAKPYQVKQYEAVSKDGTKIPYFIVMRKDVKLHGANPTLLYGYGGFMVTQEPGYMGSRGQTWLERGGIWVEANIRGGGEFGPRWHQAALLKNRHKSFEDFIAVAEDLIERKITSPRKLAIQGGSNGGLLVGAVFLMRPDLFRAVVCQAPLLDMKRYARLLAGASWMSEYGDPDDPEMWEYIRTYSPYHNLKKDAKYPAILFTTSTRDDRVHPGHTRKMAARMEEMGHEYLYYENIEGGHAGAANNEQRAYMSALAYAFLYKELM